MSDSRQGENTGNEPSAGSGQDFDSHDYLVSLKVDALPKNYDQVTGKRINVHPLTIRSGFQPWRERVRWLLLVILLVLPWVKMRGHQALLLDIVHREFSFFGFYFRAHDAPLLLFLFGAWAFGFALVTALWGRVWCGWACPQTVFIEGVYRKIESWIEGSAGDRRKLDAAPWSAAKFQKKLVKWILFTVASLIVTHSILALFVGADRLWGMVTSSPSQNPASFGFIFFATVIILIDFGWMREQFCMVACPYGKIQSLLPDMHTWLVSYDKLRGEPRRGKAKSAQEQGDCVDCKRCVQVCPTGIDIRNGSSQLECIGCAACIDACDEVMVKLGKPQGLVKYATEHQLRGEARKSPLIRFRTATYAGLTTLFLVGLGVSLSGRKPVSVTVLKTRGAPFVKVEAKQAILNTFHAELTNREAQALKITLEPGSEWPSGAELIVPQNHQIFKVGDIRQVPFMVQVPETFVASGKGFVSVKVSWTHEDGTVVNPASVEERLTLAGPLH